MQTYTAGEVGPALCRGPTRAEPRPNPALAQAPKRTVAIMQANPISAHKCVLPNAADGENRLSPGDGRPVVMGLSSAGGRAAAAAAGLDTAAITCTETWVTTASTIAAYLSTAYQQHGCGTACTTSAAGLIRRQTHLLHVTSPEDIQRCMTALHPCP